MPGIIEAAGMQEECKVELLDAEVKQIHPAIDMMCVIDSLPEGLNAQLTSNQGAGPIVKIDSGELGDMLQTGEKPPFKLDGNPTKEPFTLVVKSDSVFAPSPHLTIGIGNAQKAYVQDLSARMTKAFYVKKGHREYALVQRFLNITCYVAWKIRSGVEVKYVNSGPKLPRGMNAADAVRDVILENMQALEVLIPFYVDAARIIDRRDAAKAHTRESSIPAVE